MQATLSQHANPKLCLRLSERALSIAYTDGKQEPGIHHAAYTLNPGVDQAGQLKAILEKPGVVPDGYDDFTLLVDSQVMLVPADEYDADSAAGLYDQTITGHSQERKVAYALPSLSCMALFTMQQASLDLLSRRFPGITICPALAPVWQQFLANDQHLHLNPLYGFFHDGALYIFRFQRDRMRFFNRFAVEQAPDALYFLLNVWRQLGMDAETDRMVLVGSQPQELEERLSRHLRHVSVNAPTIDEGTPSVIADIPYDQLLFLERSGVS